MEKILIKNGMTYDPLTKEKTVKDIAVEGDRITSVSGFNPDYVVDASDCLVIPGLIDFHVHCFPSVSQLGINPDFFCLPNGITTCVDTGSVGISLFKSAYQHTICTSTVTVKVILHFCSAGQITSSYCENQSPQLWNREAIKETAKKYPDIIKGIKLRLTDTVLKPFNLGIEILEEGIDLARELELPVIVHVNNPGLDIDKITELLRPGDVFCHAYAGSRENILDSSGRIRDSVAAARNRGVIFDAASGSLNFLFRIASNALEQGFLPDIISTDMNRRCFNKHPVISFPRLLSRYLTLGLSIEDVIDRATINPARWLGCPELASLKEGKQADIAIFRIIDRETKFIDSEGKSVTGKKMLLPQLTMKAGVIMYSQSDFQ